MGGRIDALADLGSGVVVAGFRTTNGGQIWRSTDYGATWALTQNIGADIATMAFDPGSGRAYALTGAGSLWVSTDAGVSWSSLGSVTSGTSAVGGLFAYGLTVTPAGTVLVANTATNGSVFRSTDGGVSFTNVRTFTGDQGYRFQPVAGAILLNTFGGNIRRSTDDGVTWSSAIAVSAPSALFAIEHLGGAVALAASEAGTIYRSTDSGATWSAIVTVDGAADDFVALDNGRVIYCTYTSRRHIYLSADNGLSWRDVGPIGTRPDDNLDHVIAVATPSGKVAVGGTILGYIARAF